MQRFSLCPELYNELLNLLNNQHFVDQPGKEGDMYFLMEDWWLRDTAVIELLSRRRGMWEIHLVFAHFRRPMTFIKRMINCYTSRQKAVHSAAYMRRLAAKDQRGTLEVDLKDFQVCAN